MMFNGFLVYGDSDTSDFTKSDGPSSFTESASSETARAQDLEQRLRATAEILKNKEETFRLRGESLALAEATIADLQAKLVSRPPPADQSVVKTLKENLSMIEELYRECFYESVRQDDMIQKLRNACAEGRKAGGWGKDVAVEVEDLKMEITNFLNNSNNDSGVWERDGEMAAELRQIATQLITLRNMLTAECTCGLEEQNQKLMQINKNQETRLKELRQKVAELEAVLEDKENLDSRYEQQIQMKSQELHRIRQMLLEVERTDQENSSTLKSKIGELEDDLKAAKEQCETQEGVILQLQQQLNKSEEVCKENRATRGEVSLLARQVARWRRQLAAAARRLAELRAALEGRCRHQEEKIKEQDLIIKEQESIIRYLQHQTRNPDTFSQDPCCSRSLSQDTTRQGRRCVRETQRYRCPSCSRSSQNSVNDPFCPPVPPRRLSKRKPLCGDMSCRCNDHDSARSGSVTPILPLKTLSDSSSSSHYHFCHNWPTNIIDGEAQQSSRICRCGPPLLSGREWQQAAERLGGERAALAAAARRWGCPPR